jgi:hypothetical protein
MHTFVPEATPGHSLALVTSTSIHEANLFWDQRSLTPKVVGLHTLSGKKLSGHTSELKVNSLIIVVVDGDKTDHVCVPEMKR